jgi:hypothetical protein
MKVAVILTGYCREYEKTYEALNTSIFEKYDTDIYISSWDVIQQRPETWNSTNPESNKEYVTTPADTAGVIRLYNSNNKLIDFNFENWNSYYKNRFPNIQLLDREDDIFKTNDRAKFHGSFWIERLRDQWWIVKKGFELIKNPNKYDVILRIRFDILLESININPYSEFTIPMSDILHKIDVQYCDYFGYGPPESMRKYCNLFNHIETLYNDYNIDISHAELMLKFYMLQFKNSIITNIDNNIKYTLLKKQFMIKPTNYHSEWQNNRINFILSKYPKEFFNGKTILELGACNGYIGAYFTTLGAKVHCVEGRPENVVNILNSYPNVTAECANLDTADWKFGKYDIIINFGLYYHLHNYHKEHLINCINNCDLMFFESVIYDSNNSQIFFRQENGFDQSLSSIGGTPSTSYVENILIENNSQYELFKDSSLNGKASLDGDNFGDRYTHVYDWVDTGNDIYNEFYRRFWIINLNDKNE